MNLMMLMWALHHGSQISGASWWHTVKSLGKANITAPICKTSCLQPLKKWTQAYYLSVLAYLVFLQLRVASLKYFRPLRKKRRCFCFSLTRVSIIGAIHSMKKQQPRLLLNMPNARSYKRLKTALKTLNTSTFLLVTHYSRRGVN